MHDVTVFTKYTIHVGKKCLIKLLRQEKVRDAKRICSSDSVSEFVTLKQMGRQFGQQFLRKIDKTGSVERKVGSGRPRLSECNSVSELTCSQENKPGTRKLKSSRNPDSYRHIPRPAALCDVSSSVICDSTFSDVRRHSCCLVRIARRQ